MRSKQSLDTLIDTCTRYLEDDKQIQAKKVVLKSFKHEVTYRTMRRKYYRSLEQDV